MSVTFSFPSVQNVKTVIPYTEVAVAGGFPAIPISDYGYGTIHIFGVARLTTVAVLGSIILRLNGDAGNNYRSGFLGRSDVALNEGAEGDIANLNSITAVAANQNANEVSPYDILIYNYSNANLWKYIINRSLYRGGTVLNTANAQTYNYGMWKNTALVTSVDLTVFGGNNLDVGSSYCVELIGKR